VSSKSGACLTTLRLTIIFGDLQNPPTVARVPSVFVRSQSPV